MNKSEFSLRKSKEDFLEIVKGVDHKTLGVWAFDCAVRVLPYYEQKYPNDHRPEKALKTLMAWIDTGVFKMSVIRNASLDAHASAREVGEDSPARSSARACGQATATAHVKAHSIGAAIYAQQAIFRATSSLEDVTKERNWQYQHLLNLSNFKTPPNL